MFYHFNTVLNTFQVIPCAAKSQSQIQCQGKGVSHLVYDLKVGSSRWQCVWCSVIKGCNTSKQEEHAVILQTFLSGQNTLCQAVAPELRQNPTTPYNFLWPTNHGLNGWLSEDTKNNTPLSASIVTVRFQWCYLQIFLFSGWLSVEHSAQNIFLGISALSRTQTRKMQRRVYFDKK